MVRFSSGLAVLALALTGCGSGGDGYDCPDALSQSIVATTCPGGGRTFDYALLTHCGIRWAKFEGKRWVTPFLSNEAGNGPPKGWDNPVQEGQVRLLSKNRAIFMSEGHEPLKFRATRKHWPEPGCA